jgi:hypothetical protein
MARMSKAEKLELAEISSDPAELEKLAGDRALQVRQFVVKASLWKKGWK